MQLHRDCYCDDALLVFVANLDSDFASVPFWQQLATDFCGCLCGFSLRCIEVGNSSPSSSETNLAP